MIPLGFLADIPVAVFGLGRSGLAAARALHAAGAEVMAWDDSADARTAAAGAGVPLTDLYRADWRRPRSLVLAPGIPHTYPEPHPVAALAREHGVEIVSDVELLGRARPEARFIGITGTNGKSTTTALIGHILDHAGRAPQVGGNLGRPALDFEPAAPGQPYVLEMSSFQLERTRAIAFEVAVLLNIAPDHLERHGGMDGYIAAKRAIFNGRARAQTAVVGVDDRPGRTICDELRTSGDRTVVPISAHEPVAGGVYIDDGVVVDDRDGTRALDLSEITSLPGAHNWQNAAAAYAACRAAGLPAPAIAAAMRGFPGLPHRQEPVAVIDGVAFVNDSKATNADAAARALASYGRIHWIVGGRAKADGLNGTEPYRARIARVYAIGEAGETFADALDDVPVARCGDLATAVAHAFDNARAERDAAPVVLLSPACASFDQYESFAARGEHFRDLAGALPGPRGRFAPAFLDLPAASRDRPAGGMRAGGGAG